MPETPSSPIAKVLDSARRKLLETGTRNRLIHVNRANKRANFLNVINERSDDIFSLLRVQSKRMRFKAMGQDKDDEGQEMLLALPDTDLEADSARHTDLFLETPLGPDALARRLLRLAHDARTAEEEQGLNILYLAMGFLRWKEAASSETWREAPLILLPVRLLRNESSSTYDIVARDDDITTNLPLQERLRQDFGIILPEVEEEDGWTPSAYFERVSEAVSGKPGWALDDDGMQLGFFSFAKLLMHRDLDLAVWSDAALSGNPLLRGLLAEGFAADVPMFGPGDRLDAILDPAKIIQVIDADASQTKVIEEVRNGASLVVQGPPGTGKSQTITNVIAAAAHDGKSVLFVAEKMAALSVVHDRLVKTGLRDVCLELHSRTANKKALAQELGRTLAASAQTFSVPGDPTRLRLTRDELNGIAELLHAPLAPSGESPFQSMSEIIGFMGRGAKAPSISEDGLDKLTRGERKTAQDAIASFVIALARVGTPDRHPFRGTMAVDLQPTDLARLENELAQAGQALHALAESAAEHAAALRCPEPRTLDEVRVLADGIRGLASAPDDAATFAPVLFEHAGKPRLREALQAGDAWARAQGEAASTFSASAWNAGVGVIRAGLIRGQGSFFSRLFGPYKRASSELAGLMQVPLPKAPADRLALADRLADVQTKRQRLEDDELWLKGILADEWRGERTAFAPMMQVAQWLGAHKATGAFSSADDVLRALAAFADPMTAGNALHERANVAQEEAEVVTKRLALDLSQAGVGSSLSEAQIPELVAAFAQMAADVSRYGDWAALGRSLAAAVKSGAGAIVDAISEGIIDPAEAEAEFAYACAEARWNDARARLPRLNDLPALDRHDLVRVFRDLEKERIEAAKTLILSRHFERMPRGTMGEMGIIRGEIARKRGHKPIRWMMKHAGSMLQRIKPVMLMSPLSVAQFLPPGQVTFDLLVIDEASQIRPEDALGVIARARQIVVVGDQKQLPPTSFFDRLADDAEEEDDENEEVSLGATAADMESILSLCEARGLRSRMLEWHYRSRGPSLIRVSNAEFYGDNLVLPPSPLQLDDDYGMKFHRVPGVYARGNSGLGRAGTNRIEAQAVAKAVAEHARKWPDLSLGVVAFSKTQADMLTEVLEVARRQDPVLDGFLREGRQEDVFVKNIENVQGDERDVILISVGYGPQEPNGRLASMSFGPVNGEGGERRLNVLFSRARVRCEIFASFDPGDIDPSRSIRVGPRVLKRFLQFAKTGDMEEAGATGLEADSPFEEDVAEAIRAMGYLADPQVGAAGFRIDIGVRHPDRPGQYLVAVECDGAAYHGALWARERDRLRQEVLENLGWKFHRIWSTDWFHHRGRELERLRNALDAARDAGEDGRRVRGANHGSSSAAHAPEESAVASGKAIEIGHLELTAPAYVRADLQVRSLVEPHEAPIPQLGELVARIVEIEGPIHIDEVARRITSAFGRSRAGSRIVEATKHAVDWARRQDSKVQQVGPFLMTAAQMATVPVRDRSNETAGILKAVYLPPMEVTAAARLISKESGEMESEQMTRAVARFLGFQRVGPDLAQKIQEVLANLGQEPVV